MSILKNLGTALSKSEQRAITGARNKMICSCSGSGSAMDTVICTFGTLQGGLNCLSGSASYCNSTYGGGVSCSISPIEN